MGPTTGYTISPNQQGENKGNSEEMKVYQHARNMTGVVGDSKWHFDVKVNEVWDKFSVPPSNG